MNSTPHPTFGLCLILDFYTAGFLKVGFPVMFKVLLDRKGGAFIYEGGKVRRVQAWPGEGGRQEKAY